MIISFERCLRFSLDRNIYKESLPVYITNETLQDPIQPLSPNKQKTPEELKNDVRDAAKKQRDELRKQVRKEAELKIVRSIPGLDQQMAALEKHANEVDQEGHPLQPNQEVIDPYIVQKGDSISKVLFAYGLKDKRLLYSLAIANLTKQLSDQKVNINQIYIGDEIQVNLVKEGAGEQGRYKLYIKQKGEQLKESGFDLFSENFYEALQNPSDINKQEAPVRQKRTVSNKPRPPRQKAKVEEYDPQKALTGIQEKLPAGNESFKEDLVNRVDELTKDHKTVIDIDVVDIGDNQKSIRLWLKGEKKPAKSITVSGNISIDKNQLLKAVQKLQPK